MSYKEYLQGIIFIKQVSGTEEEKAHRLQVWKQLAYPLVTNR